LSQPTTRQTVLFPDLLDRLIIARFDQSHGSSDGGAVLLKVADERLGLMEGLAACLREERQPGKIDHEIVDLLRQRIFSIACGYADRCLPEGGSFHSPQRRVRGPRSFRLPRGREATLPEVW